MIKKQPCQKMSDELLFDCLFGKVWCKFHMSTDLTKSALACLAAGNSAVVCLEFAQTEVV